MTAAGAAAAGIANPGGNSLSPKIPGRGHHNGTRQGNPRRMILCPSADGISNVC